MSKFQIKFKDPETQELVEELKEFRPSVGTTAREWAEDYAYARSDKGWYSIKEVSSDH